MENPNLEYINQLSAGNKEFEIKIISILKSELPQEVKIYQEAIISNEYKVAADCVHKLKHKVSFLGLIEGYAIAEKYENALKIDQIEMKKEFEEILNKIQNFVVTL
ncbi:Hpt domain-containing protein [Flavobacterium sp. TSSA_36]|jgi:HPt (histidine-containing phosphotransfer) domain-containing protein|uniref:Hpt domain-containing protein n=1 Tax=Flavobacterium sp. TSSA_36 TaxID=3447669 RepID=UPI003F2B106F